MITGQKTKCKLCEILIFTIIFEDLLKSEVRVNTEQGQQKNKKKCFWRVRSVKRKYWNKNMKVLLDEKRKIKIIVLDNRAQSAHQSTQSTESSSSTKLRNKKFVSFDIFLKTNTTHDHSKTHRNKIKQKSIPFALPRDLESKTKLVSVECQSKRQKS